MAEFNEVMHNIQRRCNLCGQGEDIGCTIKGSICVCIANIADTPHDADWNELEKEVMRWAAEHPEPVYPTWFDYLRTIGMGCASSSAYRDEWILTNRIPADIAQKLGIEPKEG